MTPPQKPDTATGLVDLDQIDLDQVFADPDVVRAVLDLGDGYGVASVRVLTDWATARTYYLVHAPRIRGVWTVTIDAPTATDHVAVVDAHYGFLDDGPGGWREEQRKGLPTINGVALRGGTRGIHAATAAELTARTVNVLRVTPAHGEYRAAAPTAHRMAAVLRALLSHYLSRPDLHRLHRAAISLAAPKLYRCELAAIEKLETRYAQLTAELRTRRRHARRLQRLTSDPETSEVSTPARQVSFSGYRNRSGENRT